MSKRMRTDTAKFEILLASASPRRQQLLRQVGVPFRVVNHNVEEIRIGQESAAEFVLRLAEAKAQSALDQLPAGLQVVVLGADTAVVCEEMILGKPKDRADALEMLGLLSGRRHRVLSAVAVISRTRNEVALSTSEVEFRELATDELDAYWQSGEPSGKAGAYAIQGLAAIFVKKLQGSYSGVMGLPLYETAQLLDRFTIPCWQSTVSDTG